MSDHSNIHQQTEAGSNSGTVTHLNACQQPMFYQLVLHSNELQLFHKCHITNYNMPHPTVTLHVQ